MNRFALVAFALCLAPAACSAQVYAAYYAPVGAPMIAPTAYYAPATTTVYRPLLPWRPTVVSSTAAIAAVPVAAPVPVTYGYAPAPVVSYGAVAAPVTVTRYRPVLGGAVSRTRYLYSPVTVSTYGPGW